jgi:hypothetical protein
MNSDEVGEKALLLGGYTRECLEALPDMSPEVAVRVAQMLYRDMERAADLDAILKDFLGMDFELAHRVMRLVAEQSKHWPSSKVMGKLARNDIMSEWIQKNNESLMRKMGVGSDPLGRGFYAANAGEKTWNISVKWKDEAGQEREEIHKLEGPSTEEEAHDLWIKLCSKESEAPGTHSERDPK